MISLIVDGVKTVFGWIAQKSKAKHEKEMAALELEKRLLLSQHEANSQWEIAQLKDKDKLLRWGAFLLFASPLLASLISPEWGHRVQSAWHVLEPWQSNVLSGMCLGVFGMRKIPELLGRTVGNIKQGLKQ